MTGDRILVWLLIIFILISVIITIGVWREGEAKWKLVLEQNTYINDIIARDATITKGERGLKYQKFYMKVIGLYSPANNNRRMGKMLTTDYVRWTWRLTDLLVLPSCYLTATCVMETEFDLLCTGDIGEEGFFQHHRTTVPSILYYERQLRAVSPEIASEINLQLLEHKDLRNPITSLKAQAILAWGLRREFPDEIYWISASHWGSAKVLPWYNGRCEPKDRYYFYSENKIKKVDVRSPLLYYFHYTRVNANFERFNPDLGKWIDEYKKYKDECKKDELEYLKVRELINKLIKMEQKLEEKGSELDDGIKQVANYKAQINALDKDFREIYGQEKKYSYETMYKKTKKRFEDFIKKKK